MEYGSPRSGIWTPRNPSCSPKMKNAMTPDSPFATFAAGALRGVRVLDLSRVVAGPYVGRLFADLGADVIKLEPPEGDQVHRIAAEGDEGHSAFYTFANVGKRGVCVDLKQPAGVALLLELAAHCDVVVENIRPAASRSLASGCRLLLGIEVCASEPSDSPSCTARLPAPAREAVAAYLGLRVGKTVPEQVVIRLPQA
jgi:hypothetical protein